MVVCVSVIYEYTCMCVCVCVCISARRRDGRHDMWLKGGGGGGGEPRTFPTHSNVLLTSPAFILNGLQPYNPHPPISEICTVTKVLHSPFSFSLDNECNNFTKDIFMYFKKLFFATFPTEN